MEFEEVKQIALNSVDESANMNELIQIVINKIYQQGVEDGKMEHNGNREKHYDVRQTT